MVVLPIPQRRVVFVDGCYYDHHSKDIRSFAQRHSLDLEVVNNDYDNPTWPCNSLVVEIGNRVIAITPKQPNDDFSALLRARGITPLDVPYSYNCRMGGGIHCTTNEVPISHLKEVIQIFGKI